MDSLNALKCGTHFRIFVRRRTEARSESLFGYSKAMAKFIQISIACIIPHLFPVLRSRLFQFHFWSRLLIEA